MEKKGWKKKIVLDVTGRVIPGGGSNRMGGDSAAYWTSSWLE